ncbi:hypothetical protein ACIQI7_32300 [Kitasatospora sp. NPDC092039]|uniref:hypothetical protein n=1 Tax=Kitasatospora sp. NPDC092039 TaxID=3364086 RepID=UPI0038304CD0
MNDPTNSESTTTNSVDGTVNGPVIQAGQVNGPVITGPVDQTVRNITFNGSANYVATGDVHQTFNR